MDELDETVSLLYEYFDKNIEKVDLWFHTANPMLGGMKPIWMIALNRKHKLLKIVKDMLDGNIA